MPSDEFDPEVAIKYGTSGIEDDLMKHVFVEQPFIANALKEKREANSLQGIDSPQTTVNPFNLVSRLLPPIYDAYDEAETNLKDTSGSVKNVGSKLNSLDSFLNTLQQYQDDTHSAHIDRGGHAKFEEESAA